MTSNKSIRAEKRALRRTLSSGTRQRYDARINQFIQDHPLFQRSTRISAFKAFDGEVNLEATFDVIWQAGKSLYLPVIIGKGQPLKFVRYNQEDSLIEAEFGIYRPDKPEAEWVAPSELDLVLTPLVAYNENGFRLGVGGGFYDRSFAFTKNHIQPTTSLLGVAYSTQLDNDFTVEEWDVPLHALVNESEILEFKR